MRASSSSPRRPRWRLRLSLESATRRSSSRTKRGITKSPSRKPLSTTSARRPSMMALVSTITCGRMTGRTAGATPGATPGAMAGALITEVTESVRSRTERSMRSTSARRPSATATPTGASSTAMPMGAKSPAPPGRAPNAGERRAAASNATTRPNPPRKISSVVRFCSAPRRSTVMGQKTTLIRAVAARCRVCMGSPRLAPATQGPRGIKRAARRPPDNAVTVTRQNKSGQRSRPPAHCAFMVARSAELVKKF